MATSIRDLLRFDGSTPLVDLATHATPGLKGTKKDARKELARLNPQLAAEQEKLFAQGYVGGAERVLLVIQGMDTSGKGGVLKHIASVFDPGGLKIASFKKPTTEELAHDFLWRIDRALPEPGYVGVFDRSHYEDVLVVKVHRLADDAEIERRYDAINTWEKAQAAAGTRIVKCMLHIDPSTQKERLLARLDDPTKQWKFKPGDVDERELWPSYMAAYQTALERCHTDVAPWYVIPADRKWYRDWAVGHLLAETFVEMSLDWPQPDYDVAEQRRRLADEKPIA